ncbi:unnamed protein product, partial [Oppiella nova]
MEWIGNFCFDANTHQMSYIYGFDSRNFVVWDEREQRFIESIDCGGGHRSWDFVMSKIRVNSDLMVSKMSHSKKINCCSLLFTTSSMYFATAGEENVIHINSLDMKTHAFQIELYLFGHISNISAITCSSPKKCPNTCYMVSVGGRTQLMLWFIEIKDKNLFCKQLLNKFLWDSNDMHNRTKDMKTCSPEDPQIRYLDANMCQISDDQYLISTACSDSAFRLYTTSVNTSCVLRVLNAFKSHVITASNDGTLKIWSLMEGYLDKLLADDLQSKPIELNSVFEMRTHEAGINALDICLLNGIKILSRNRILSAAIDQRIILWKYELDSEELCLNLEPISSHVSKEILQAPDGQEEGGWKYEHLRQFCLQLNRLAVKLQTECSPQTCTQMTATEQWIFLCAAHKTPKECPAIDYTRHTLDGAACLLNSNKYFPSRVTIKESSVAKLGSVCRRVYRIFSHAFFHHKTLFDEFENEMFLCKRFTAFVIKYNLMSKDNLIVPIVGLD